ncbi:MAG: extracellular solute-binding protein, partial [Clostridia bacterium]|nr:extracellular solute-binding protein [Clostridia bacterium]
SSWDSILEGKFNKKATIKDSIRDTYIMAVGAVYEDELKSLDKNASNYSSKLAEIFNRTDDETVRKVEEFLKQIKNNIYGFEVDSGKNDMIDGKIQVNFAWSGDAVYVIDEAEAQGKEFGYVVPLEGSNVWFDGFVMPKGANVENAKKFIDFVSTPEIAIRNMEYIGYTSCVAGAGDEITTYVYENSDDEGEVEIDLSYFFGKEFKAKASSEYGRLATQFPDVNVVKRCTVMDNFNDEDLAVINEMWNRVKFITLPFWLIYVIVGIALIVVVFVLFSKFKDKIFSYAKRKRKWKVISREEI